MVRVADRDAFLHFVHPVRRRCISHVEAQMRIFSTFKKLRFASCVPRHPLLKRCVAARGAVSPDFCFFPVSKNDSNEFYPPRNFRGSFAAPTNPSLTRKDSVKS
jgi:hypothetical protein